MSEKRPSDRAAPRRLPRAEREVQMLDAAARLFGKQGYDATSMDDIAAACGVTKPMLYAYFGSKEGLHKALVARAGKHVIRAIAELSAERDPKARMHKAADAMISFVEGYRDSWQLVFSGGNRAQQPASIAVYRNQLLMLTTSTLAKFRPKEMSKERAMKIVEPYAHVFLGAAEAGAQWWLSTPGVTIPQVKKLADDVIEGMAMMVQAKFAELRS